MAKASQIPIPWPGPDFTVTFRTSKLKAFSFLAVSLAFVILGTWAGAAKANTGAIVGIVFFAACGLVFSIQLHPRASYLTLKNDGFVYCSLFRCFEVKWEEVQGFGTWSFSHNNMVVFDYNPEFSKQVTGRRLSKILAGCEGALPDTYGFKAAELAGIMNQLRLLYLEQRPAEGA
jgi:hypothetical protein